MSERDADRSDESAIPAQSFLRVANFLQIPARLRNAASTIDVTDALIRLSGFSRSELLLQSPEQLFSSGVLPEDDFVRHCKICRADGNVVSGKFARQRMDANYILEIVTSDIPTFVSESSQREQLLRDFARSATDRFWEQDEQLRFKFITDPEHSTLDGDSLFSTVSLIPECVGMTRWELAGVDPEIDPHWRAHKQLLEERRPFRNFRYSYREPGGEVRHWRVSGIPIFDETRHFLGYRGTASDETSEIEAQAVASRAQKRLRDAIESISEGFALFDRDDRLVLCNQRYREIFPEIADVLNPGVSFEECLRVGVNRGLLANTEDKQEFIAKRLKHHRGGLGPMIIALSNNRWVRVVERPTTDGGIVGVWTDITELRQREQEILRIQKMDALGQLTGGIAHDFNNLLAVILGNLELLRAKPDQDPQRNKFLDRCNTAASRAADLTRRLLAFSKPQSLASAHLQVNGVIEDIADLMRDCLPSNINLHITFGVGLPDVFIEASQLQTAMLNLVLNARDAMPHGGGIFIETVLARDPVEGVVITVRDEGTGITPDVLTKIFDPFFTTKAAHKGSGLGLSIVYGFVTQSNGAVDVQSVVGQGTEFKIFLPASEQAVAVQSTVAPVDGLLSGDGKLVLVVEDEDAVRELVVSFLEDLGFEVLESDTGESALLLVERHDDIELVISDIVLSGSLSGAQLAKECLRRHPNLRFLLMSGYAAQYQLERDSGEEVPYLQKPFTYEQFVKALSGALGTAIS